MELTLKKDEVLKEYSFSYEKDGMSKIICKCGAHFEKKINYEERLTEAEAATLSDMKELLAFSTHEKLKCPECETNYFIADERARLIPLDLYFMGTFKFEQEGAHGTLSFQRVKAELDGEEIQLRTQTKSLHVDASNNSIVYKDFDGTETSVDLDNMVHMTNVMLSFDTVRTLQGLQEIHFFLIWLGQVTPDANKMNIVGELIAPIRNKVNNAGLEYIHRAMCVLLSIIKFPNLSTIALTKNMIFLSDLIFNCDMPPSATMREENKTSPLDIFNGLTESYLKRIKNELSFDHNTVKEYKFRPSSFTPDIAHDGGIVLTDKSSSIIESKDIPNEGPQVVKLNTGEIALKDSAYSTGTTWNNNQELTIRVRDQLMMDKAGQTRLSQSGRGERGGRSGVETAIIDGSITKFIYDSLRTFADYQKLCKYFKFYSKHELSALLKNYELDYLTHFIDVAYWRERMDDNEFYRMSKIIKDFIKIQTVNKRMFVDNKNIDEIDEKDLDYTLMEKFDFTIYDDSISMLESMKDMTAKQEKQDPDDAMAIHLNAQADEDGSMFDRARYFDKIRDYKKLKNFHDSLSAQYHVLVKDGLSKDSSYDKFVNKYEWLEDKANYDGPIEVQLLRTMNDFIKEGHIMMSSQAQYGAKVSQGIYLVARLIDNSKGTDEKEAKRFTIGFSVDRYGFLEFDQLKEYKNAQASDRVKEEVRKWMKAKDITYDERTTDIRFRNS